MHSLEAPPVHMLRHDKAYITYLRLLIQLNKKNV
uniref:Uncharacterized protein n=1 Tax=Anguilla anguilla TaxID=7936 RepID=A0A0E9PDR6_ANGAN